MHRVSTWSLIHTLLFQLCHTVSTISACRQEPLAEQGSAAEPPPLPLSSPIPLHCCYEWLPAQSHGPNSPLGWIIMCTCDALGRLLHPRIIPLHPPLEPLIPPSSDSHESSRRSASAQSTSPAPAAGGTALQPLLQVGPHLYLCSSPTS